MDSNTQPIIEQPLTQSIGQPVETEPKRRFPTLLFFLFGVLLLIVAVGAYYLGIKSSSSMDHSNTVSPTKSPYPTSDPTAKWQTYTSSSIGLTIKYPQEWAKEETQSTGKISGVTLHGVEGSVAIFWGQGGGGGCPLENQKQIDFGGELVTACDDTTANGDETWSIYRQIQGVSVAVTATAKANTKPFILSILSQVEFGTKTLSVDTTNWQTYASTNGFSLKYPSTWTVAVLTQQQKNERDYMGYLVNRVGLEAIVSSPDIKNGYGPRLEISVYNNPDMLSLSQFISLHTYNVANMSPAEDEKKAPNFNYGSFIKNFSSLGIAQEWVINRMVPDAQAGSEEVLIANGKQVIGLDLTSRDNALIDAFVSTFKSTQ